VLVNLQFDRRRWKKDETFTGQVWIVNDTYRNYDNCTVELTIADENNNRLHEQNIDVAIIATDSSESIASIRWDITSRVERQFHVSLSLRDNAGQELSHNQYLLLIGDQALARVQMRDMGQARSARNKAFTSGNYYRFFPEMIQEDDHDWESQTQTPRAKSFPQSEKPPQEHSK
jgi:beta-mannosidase